jgi:hypothetical protein
MGTEKISKSKYAMIGIRIVIMSILIFLVHCDPADFMPAVIKTDSYVCTAWESQTNGKYVISFTPVMTCGKDAFLNSGYKCHSNSGVKERDSYFIRFAHNATESCIEEGTVENKDYIWAGHCLIYIQGGMPWSDGSDYGPKLNEALRQEMFKELRKIAAGHEYCKAK